VFGVVVELKSQNQESNPGFEGFNDEATIDNGIVQSSSQRSTKYMNRISLPHLNM